MKLNRHQIAGRIVDDPEYGNLPNGGIATIKLRVVTDDGWYDQKKKEYQKRSSYHTVKRIGKDVDQMEFRKDDWVFVEGQLLTDSWEDREGNKKFATFIRAAIVVEIPDPWEKKDTGGNRGSSQRNDNRETSSRDDRGPNTRDGGRDDRRDSRQDNRSGGRDRDSGRGGRDDRGRDDRSRDSGRGRTSQAPPPDDDIPF
jgi:single-strand DNA-binding protein